MGTSNLFAFGPYDAFFLILGAINNFDLFLDSFGIVTRFYDRLMCR